jgi:hypothetical protein
MTLRSSGTSKDRSTTMLTTGQGDTCSTSGARENSAQHHSNHSNCLQEELAPRGTSPCRSRKLVLEKRRVSCDDVPDLYESRGTGFRISTQQPSRCENAPPRHTRRLSCPIQSAVTSDSFATDLQDNGETVAFTIRRTGQAWKTLGNRFTARQWTDDQASRSQVFAYLRLPWRRRGEAMSRTKSTPG